MSMTNAYEGFFMFRDILLNELFQFVNNSLPLIGILLLAATLQRRMFTTNDLMERWSVNRDTILHFIHVGRLKAIDVSRSKGRASWRIPADAVEIFETANESPEWNAPPQPKRRTREANVVEFFP